MVHSVPGTCTADARIVPRRRGEAYKGILEAARAALLGAVDGLPPAQLLELLEMSFPFIRCALLSAGS